MVRGALFSAMHFRTSALRSSCRVVEEETFISAFGMTA
jgi:hypothetical protein